MQRLLALINFRNDDLISLILLLIGFVKEDLMLYGKSYICFRATLIVIVSSLVSLCEDPRVFRFDTFIVVPISGPSII
jgi:hypothetical protein